MPASPSRPRRPVFDLRVLPPPPRPAARALHRALTAFDARDRRVFEAALAEGLDADPEGVLTRILVGRTRLLAGAFDRGLADLARAAALAEDPGYPRRLRLAWLIRLHYLQEARADLEPLLIGPLDPNLAHVAVGLLARTGAPARSLPILAALRAGADLPEAVRADLALTEGRHAGAAGDADRAEAAFARALAGGSLGWGPIRETLLGLGRPDALARLATAHPRDPGALAIRAELALFASDLAAADRLAAAAPSDPLARQVRAAVATLRDAPGAAARLDALVDARPDDPAAFTWRAEHRRRRGDLEGAAEDLFQAKNRRADYLAAKIRFALVDQARGGPRPVSARSYEGLAAQLTAAGFPVALGEVAEDPGPLLAAARACLEALGGNLTPWPTRVGPAGLEAVPVAPSPRTRARAVQHQVVWRGIDATLATLAPVLEALDHHPVAECYRGELLLWAGRLPEARACFEGVVGAAPGTTWGWFGLAATRTAGGDPEGALAALDRGRAVLGYAGASMPMYRGEALWRLGRLDEASDALARATALHPTRFAAWVLRVLVEDARGQAAARDAAFGFLAREAAPLLHAAAETAGVTLPLWGSEPADAFAQETRVAVAGAALDLLGGSRSSACPVWFAPGTGAVRSLVLHHPPLPEGARAPARAALARDLDQAIRASRAPRA